MDVNALTAFTRLIRAATCAGSAPLACLSVVKLSASQFAILEALNHSGPLSQRELAKSLLVSDGNITFIIDNLEKRTLVKRVRSMDDRRVQHVHLTRAGQNIIRKILPVYQQEIIDLFDNLTIVEQQTLSKICLKLEQAVNTN
jgi:MarR family transcriptional regulator, 2-MHQ and catechol-resistance regulon repressor